MNSMNMQETRAWLTVLAEILKADGIIWTKLSPEEQSKYLVKWAKNVNTWRESFIETIRK